MAVYRIGDIIRMKREALGITREKLCEMFGEGCEVQTLYRIETGKVKVKQKVYRRLMECMRELPERSYASILVLDYRALNLKMAINIHLAHREYEQAEKKLNELKQFMDGDYVRNQQFLLEIKSKMAYYKQQISIEEYLENLWKALRYTIPSIDKIELERWPYNQEEFDILIAIVGIYAQRKQREQEEQLLLQLKKSIEKRYMDEDYYVSRHTYCLDFLSQLMSIQKQHEKSMEYCEEGIEELKKQVILSCVQDLLYDLAWNKEKMIQKELLDKKERESCKRLLVQAYYLSVAQGIEHSSERIKELCERNYPGEITLL